MTRAHSPAARSVTLLLVLGLILPACRMAAQPSADPAEAARVVALLRLQPGQQVADVGAGDGEWTAVLLERVLPAGRAWATEIDDGLVASLAERFAGEPVEVVLGDQDGTGLPDGCCDAILLRLVYHHFTAPLAMRRSLAAALRPEGLLLIIDMEPREGWRQLPDVPDRDGHGIPLEEVAGELTAEGWEELARDTDWPGLERYALLLRRPAGDEPADP